MEPCVTVRIGRRGDGPLEGSGEGGGGHLHSRDGIAGVGHEQDRLRLRIEHFAVHRAHGWVGGDRDRLTRPATGVRRGGRERDRRALQAAHCRGRRLLAGVRAQDPGDGGTAIGAGLHRARRNRAAPLRRPRDSHPLDRVAILIGHQHDQRIGQGLPHQRCLIVPVHHLDSGRGSRLSAAVVAAAKRTGGEEESRAREGGAWDDAWDLE